MDKTFTLTVQDLALIQSIIDTACTRGAFRATEMRAVGETYEKLSHFLQSCVQDQSGKKDENSTITNQDSQRDNDQYTESLPLGDPQ